MLIENSKSKRRKAKHDLRKFLDRPDALPETDFADLETATTLCARLAENMCPAIENETRIAKISLGRAFTVVVK